MRKSEDFTLIEVVVSIAILALGLSSLLSLMAVASNRSAKAEARWESAHKTSQATEFFLLCGPKARIDDRFLPYQGAAAECHLEKVEGLPEGVQDTKGQWRLARMRITVSQDGVPSESVDVEKILKTADCE